MMNQPFDRKLVARHRLRALLQSKPDSDFLFRKNAPWLTDRLLDIKRTFDTAIDLSSLPIAPYVPPGRIGKLWRMQPVAFQQLDIVGEEELLPLAKSSLDLIISHLSLHWANDLLGTFLQMRYALKPDGLLLVSFLGGKTLFELRHALAQAESEVTGGLSPRIAPMADLRQTAGLLQRAGFTLPVIESETITATYSDFYTLLRELRMMGESNALNERIKHFTRRAIFTRAEEIYRKDHTDQEGRLCASFETFFLTGWAPDPSQQQPAKRGSGQVPLGDILNKGNL